MQGILFLKKMHEMFQEYEGPILDDICEKEIITWINFLLQLIDMRDSNLSAVECYSLFLSEENEVLRKYHKEISEIVSSFVISFILISA